MTDTTIARHWFHVLATAAMLAAWLPASAALCVWDGGGADDNLSTAANWVGDTPPSSGDILVFRGNVRTSPVNDYDPETTVFETLVFSNTCATTETSASFTLTGNKIVLTGGQTFAMGTSGIQKGYAICTISAKASAPLTDTLDLEISLPNNASGSSKFGGCYTKYHHLLFKKTVSAPSGELRSADQMQSTVTFEGPVSGFSNVMRPNGNGGMVWLRSSENAFSSAAPAHNLREGSLKVDSQAAAGGAGCSFSFGQNAYETPGKLYVNAQEDTLFTGALSINGPNYRSGAAHLYNTVAGTTATFTGRMTASVSHSSYDNCDGLGTALTLGGVGNGVLTGNLAAVPVWIYKNDAGTWTLAGDSSATGSVTVSAGTLLVNGNYATAQRSQVAANARLGGTGRLGDVTLKTSAILAATNLAGATSLHVGTLSLLGLASIDLLDAVVPAAGTYTVLTFDQLSGTGSFSLGTGWPEGSSLNLGATALTVTIPTSVRNWTGSVSSDWDFTTANWTNLLYEDGLSVVFGEAGERTAVTLTQEVRPTSLAFTGTKDYTLTGAGIAGPASLTKRGTGTLVLANTNTYTGSTTVEGGVLRLEGSLAGSSLVVGSGAAFTNTVAASISGTGSLVSEGTVELNGTNTFTGGLTLKGSSVVTDAHALGAGDVTVGGTKTIQIGGSPEAIGRGRTLYTVYADESEGHALTFSRGAFTWLGNVVIRNRRLHVAVLSGSPLTFGEPGCTTTFTAEDMNGTSAIYVRNNGTVRFYSRVDMGATSFTQTDSNTIYFHAPNNRWSELQLLVGTVCCCTNNALAPSVIRMGQTYGEHVFNPSVDLGGYDQTIAGLAMNNSASFSSQTIRSTKPATLTVSNDVDTTTLRMQCAIKGAVTLRKAGTGTWTLGAKNQTTGNVEVVAGTLKLTASDTLPPGKTSMLSIESGARLVLDTGVAASIAYATCGGHPLKAGTYCGEGGQGTRLDAYIGAGTGTLTVTRGVNGLTLIIR